VSDTACGYGAPCEWSRPWQDSGSVEELAPRDRLTPAEDPGLAVQASDVGAP
jgi:hypothetical protein